MTKARDLANAGTALGAVSATELAFVDGVTSAIQTQIDAKAPSSTAVTLTDTQTLTNKTLTSPVIASVVNNTLTSTTGDMIYASAANTPARLGIGSTSQVLTVSGGIPAWATPAGAAIQSACFRDEKAINNQGGTFTSGAWRTRDLNATQFNGITSASLASNQITLPAGTYGINASLPSYTVSGNQGRLFNITDSTQTILGNSIRGLADQTMIAQVLGTFTIASSKVFELQHQCLTTTSGNGFGNQAGITTEVFAQIYIAKIG